MENTLWVMCPYLLIQRLTVFCNKVIRNQIDSYVYYKVFAGIDPWLAAQRLIKRPLAKFYPSTYSSVSFPSFFFFKVFVFFVITHYLLYLVYFLEWSRMTINCMDTSILCQIDLSPCIV